MPILVPQYYTAAELLADEVEPLEFIPFLGLSGFIERGATHMLTSDARMGKSTIITSCIQGWLEAEKGVLVVTEEGKRSWMERLQKQKYSFDGLRILRGHSVANPTELLAEVVDQPEPMVIIDTMRGLLKPEDENNNSDMGKVLLPWVAAFQDTGRTLIVTHHMTKSKKQGQGMNIAGAGATVSHIDNHIEVWPRKDGKPGRRITVFGRDIDNNEMTFEFRGGVIDMSSVIGKQEVTTRADLVKQEIIEMLGQKPMSTAQISKELNTKVSGEYLRRILNGMDLDVDMSLYIPLWSLK